MSRGADETPSREGPGEEEGPLGCEEALSHLFEYLDGELDPGTQERVHDHLELCKRCYPFFDFERLFLDYIRERGLVGRCDEEFAENVRALLAEVE